MQDVQWQQQQQRILGAPATALFCMVQVAASTPRTQSIESILEASSLLLL
jgi:hypothetical protein